LVPGNTKIPPDFSCCFFSFVKVLFMHININSSFKNYSYNLLILASFKFICDVVKRQDGNQELNPNNNNNIILQQTD
jgi:hypothetical protein